MSAPPHSADPPRTRRSGLLVRPLIALLLVLAASIQGARAGTGVAPASWTRIAVRTQPPGRGQFGMTVDSAGTLYVYGGRGPTGAPLADFWRLRRGDAGWQRLDSGMLPALVEPHLAADASGNIFEFGGIVEAGGGHVTPDGHSYGLYEYVAAQHRWRDLTTIEAHPAEDWPQGREDHGFAYDAGSGMFYVFAGEGSGAASLADMWRYDERIGIWTQVRQRFSPRVPIDAREIYNITPDNNGGLWLFGGAYPFDGSGKRAAWKYLNDLWRFDIAAGTWHLMAGRANAYDPTMPLPRHYYAQAADARGNFYVLGGYVSDTSSPAYFTDDTTTLYAQVVVFNLPDGPTGNIMYALADFWQFDAAGRGWIDLSRSLGDLQGAPFIPYVMVADPTMPRLLTFGGYYTNGDGELQASADLRGYPLPAGAAPTAVAPRAPRPIVPAAHAQRTATAVATASPSPSPTRRASATATATPTVPAWPTPTP